MRVPSTSLFSGMSYKLQSAQLQLDGLITKMSSMQEIDQGYQNLTIFNNALRLDKETNALQQSSNNAKDAKNFTDNSDSAFTDFTKTLTTFKTKLVGAANGTLTNSSYQVLALELRGLKDHMIEIANTSINGKYLFSGTSLSTRPIDSNGIYHGNDNKIKTVVGSNVEIPYNISGQDLFLGTDSDKLRSVTTNIKRYNASKLQSEPSQSVPISATDSIADLTGITSGNSYFYISGTRPDGSTFKDRYTVGPTAKVSDLLSHIEKAYTYNVTATMNDMGQIELQNKITGSSQLQFHIVGSDTLVNDLNELSYAGAKVIDFIRSGYNPEPVASQKGEPVQGGGAWPAADLTLNKTQYSIRSITNLATNTLVQDTNATAPVDADSMSLVFGDAPQSITVNGTTYAFAPALTGTSTMEDLRVAIETVLQNNIGIVPPALTNPNLTVSVASGAILINDANTTTPSIDSFTLNLLNPSNPADTSLPLGIKLNTLGATFSAGSSLGELFGNAIPNKIEINGTTYPFSSTLKANDTLFTLISQIQTDATPIANGDLTVSLVGNQLIFADADHTTAPGLDSVQFGSLIEGHVDPLKLNEYSFEFELRHKNTFEYAKTGDLLTDVLGQTGGNITLNISGETSLTTPLANLTTVEDLINAFQSQLNSAFPGPDVTMKAVLRQGKIVFIDNSMTTGGNLIGTVGNPQAHFRTFTIDTNPGTFMRSAALSSEGVDFTKSGSMLYSNTPQIEKDTNEYATLSTTLLAASGVQTLAGETLNIRLTDINGVKHDPVTINFTPSGTTFTIDGATYNIFDAYPETLAQSTTATANEITRGRPTPPDEVTYKQLSDILSMIISANLPADQTADAYNDAIEASRSDVSVTLDRVGRVQVEDYTNSPTQAELAIFDKNSSDFSTTGLTNPSIMNFNSNNALTIDDPKINFFGQLQEAIDAVAHGHVRADDSMISMQRNNGIQNALGVIDHLLDHVSRKQTENGALANALQLSSDRTEILILNTQKIRSEYMDADIAELQIKLSQIKLNMEALMSTIAKVSNLSLVNYLK